MAQAEAAALARELQSAEAFAARVPPTRLGVSAGQQFLWATISTAIVAVLVLAVLWLIDPDRGDHLRVLPVLDRR